MKRLTITILSAVLALASMNALAGDKATIAIIGTGDLGGSLGVMLGRSGYTIVYGSRDPTRDAAKKLVEQSGEGASVTTQIEAAQSAEIILLAVPWPPIEQIIQNIGNLDGKIVASLSFPYQVAEDGYLESGVETSIAEMIQEWHPKARVLMVSFPGAFLIDDPSALGEAPTVEIAGDDREAKEILARLTADLGLVPFDAGPTRHARYLEAIGMLYMVPLSQGRKEGIEIFFRRTSYWPCNWDATETYGKVADGEDLATMPPRAKPPVPCSEQVVFE
jgi:8-hydroxy-5-deazaflavin:NADPH oxidoreductase